MAPSAINPEWKLVDIGRGSFATVSVLSGRPVAFKHVIPPSRTLELKNEFDYLCSLFDSYNAADHFFMIPRPFAYYDPQDPASFRPFVNSPTSTNPTHPRSGRVAEKDFKALELETAAYAMNHVLPLPLTAARKIREKFYPPSQEVATLPTLCRLYFGKVISERTDGNPYRFFNSANFPLDVSRYRQMTECSRD